MGRLQPTRQPLQTVTLPISGNIFNILLEMKKQGRSDYSINFTRKALSFLAKHCNLNEPESVRTFVANYNTSSGYKRNLCITYNKYVKFYGLSWSMPLYKAPEKMPKIPSTEKIEMLISSSSKKLALKLKLSMETGLRPIELMNLRVKDIDFDNRTVHPSTAKGGSSRMLKITQGTTDMLKVHIVKHNLGLTDRLFKGSLQVSARESHVLLAMRAHCHRILAIDSVLYSSQSDYFPNSVSLRVRGTLSHLTLHSQSMVGREKARTRKRSRLY